MQQLYMHKAQALLDTCMQVECISPASLPVASLNCVQEPPITEQKCNLQECGNHLWVMLDWSSCTAVCAGGKRTRQVTCQRQQGTSTEIVSSDKCKSDSKPAEVQACNVLPCPWAEGPWGECSLPCGPGLRTREVF